MLAGSQAPPGTEAFSETRPFEAGNTTLVAVVTDARLSKGEVPAAKEDLRRLLKLKPRSALGNLLLGRCEEESGVPPEDLGELLRGTSLPFTLCPSPRQALDAARAAARPDDLVCVTGSVFHCAWAT